MNERHNGWVSLQVTKVYTMKTIKLHKRVQTVKQRHELLLFFGELDINNNNNKNNLFR